MLKRVLLASAVASGAMVGAASKVRAGALENIATKLVAIEAEVGNLGRGLARPKNIGAVESHDLASRRLVEAKVNFGIGNYDDAAVVLYDFVEKYVGNPLWDEALYYLSESLFQKGDFVASRSYFKRLVSERGSASTFYQQALERLIELTLKLDDTEEIDRWLAALDQVPQAQVRDSVPYVRGKYYYFRGQFDEALGQFDTIPETSSYYAQARYFRGTSRVAKGELGRAADVFKSLTLRKATTNDEKRIAELAHMALGRLYYERDQPSKAVDEYLRISRRSDLFDEALYEVTWVYVKNKEFDKALRALELLALADPTSERMPDVRILEGNLRIRKAQHITEDGDGNSKEEYDKAVAVFDATRESFREPYNKIEDLIAAHGDASSFLDQITGRNSETFDVSSTLPEVAAAWLRQQPEVSRIVAIEADLGQIEGEIAEAEKSIERLEAAINTPSKVNIFPGLARKRYRSIEILDNMFSIRKELAQREGALTSKYVSGAQQSQLEILRGKRRSIVEQLRGLPDGELGETERVGKARGRFTILREKAAEVSTVIDITEATLVALEKYMRDQAESLSAEDTVKVNREMTFMRSDVDAMRVELAAINKEATLARDRAGTGDAAAKARGRLRRELRVALDNEHAFMERSAASMAPGDRAAMGQIAALIAQSRKSTAGLDNINATIDAIVEQALTEIRTTLGEEKANLGAYRQEFLNYEAESRGLGGEILALSFQNVANKFYDILVRSDVGIIDVAWSLKEGAKTSLKRLNLDQARERRTLDSNFADVIREIRNAKAQELFDRAAGK